MMSTHEAQCALAYTPEQLFDLAAEVERYPEFLPWWIAARVRKRVGNVYYSDQVIGFELFRAHFVSKTVLARPERIDVTSSDRLFRRFALTWLFEPLPGSGCQVQLLFDLELRSKLTHELFRRTIDSTGESIIAAFEARAHQVYGLRKSP